jgi:hypothetical protein
MYMGTDVVMNRTDFPINIIFNVNAEEFPIANWIINPDLSILERLSIYYCKIVGDELVEMTQAEKDAVDAAKLAEEKTRVVTAVCNAREAYINWGTGVEYPAGSGKYLAVTDADQGRWIYWHSIGGKWASLGLSFPYRVYSRNGSSYVDITRAQDFTAVIEAIGVYVVNLYLAAIHLILMLVFMHVQNVEQ